MPECSEDSGKGYGNDLLIFGGKSSGFIGISTKENLGQGYG